jgi:hypothetical protein
VAHTHHRTPVLTMDVRQPFLGDECGPALVCRHHARDPRCHAERGRPRRRVRAVNTTTRSTTRHTSS